MVEQKTLEAEISKDQRNLFQKLQEIREKLISIEGRLVGDEKPWHERYILVDHQ